MKAARFENGIPEIRDLPTPVPGVEEALIRISSVGVCHSDLHLVRGDWANVPLADAVGHEAIGIVEALGAGAERYSAVGDRVILGLGGTGGGYWCGVCDYCLRGEPRHCDETQGIMGAFAEQFCVWAKSLVKVPDSIGDEEAPLACGGLTAYGAVKKLLKQQIPPGRPIAIIGAAGGLGHYAIQIAKAFGYKVVGIDVGADRLKFVESMGADLAVEPGEARDVITREFGGVDASIVFTAKMAGFDLGMKLIRRGGLFVAVGLPPSSEGSFELNPFTCFYKGATIVFSGVGTVQDMRELVDLAATGRVKSHIGRVGSLSQLGTILDELESGQYLGRAVITDLEN